MSDSMQENAGTPSDAAIIKGLDLILKIQERRRQRREGGRQP